MRLSLRLRANGINFPATHHGAIAQLAERLDRTQEVGGSNPPSSIAEMPCTSATCFFAGLSNRLRNPLLFQALVVVPHNVVHPGLLEGWGCEPPTHKEDTGEDPR